MQKHPVYDVFFLRITALRANYFIHNFYCILILNTFKLFKPKNTKTSNHVSKFINERIKVYRTFTHLINQCRISQSHQLFNCRIRSRPRKNSRRLESIQLYKSNLGKAPETSQTVLPKIDYTLSSGAIKFVKKMQKHYYIYAVAYLGNVQLHNKQIHIIKLTCFCELLY